MKNYELTVIFHPDLEMNIDPAIEKVKKILESAGGNIIKEEITINFEHEYVSI